MGSGNCVFRAPAIFDLDDQGTAVVVGNPASDEERVRLAVDDCPTAALSITSVCGAGEAVEAAVHPHERGARRG